MTDDRFSKKAKEIREAYLSYIQASNRWPGVFLENEIARALREEAEIVKTQVVSEEDLDKLVSEYNDPMENDDYLRCQGYRDGFKEAMRRNAVADIEKIWPPEKDLESFLLANEDKMKLPWDYLIPAKATYRWLKSKIIGEEK